MNIRALLFIVAIWPIYALSDTWVPITSEILGVQLWRLRTIDKSTFPFEVYEGDDNEFMSHCNDGRPIYISALEKPVKCQFKKVGAFYHIYVETNDQRVTGQRMVLVSKSPIAPKFKPLPITWEEIKILKDAERKFVAVHDRMVLRQFIKQNEKFTEKNYIEYIRSIKSSEKYQKYIGARFKLPSPNGFIYISSVGLDASGYMGWEIINIVYRKIDRQMQEVGIFAGCIQGGFRDLNSDGTPEILTSTCENGESSSESYWSLIPEVKQILGH